MALKRFQAVTDNYPETPWFAPAWFWQGQITAKQEKFAQAEKTLTYFLDLIKQKKSSELFLEYQNFSRYTLAWLALKQNKYKDALEQIQKYEKKNQCKENSDPTPLSEIPDLCKIEEERPNFCGAQYFDSR